MKIPDKKTAADAPDELHPEYGEAKLSELLANGVRGKYVERYRQGTNLVKLAPWPAFGSEGVKKRKG